MFQKDNGLVQDGVTGANTWNAILSGQTTLYTVTVQHLSKSVAEDIVGKYGGTMKAEG
jgi:peptidoglycan hydrolase-like protein with peptidoglycan-binding domain